MSTKSKKTRAKAKSAAKNSLLADALKKQMVESIIFLERLHAMRGSGILGPDDLVLISYAGNSELEYFRELLGKFLTARGLPTISVDAPQQAA
jgi:hypothetical protein